jgi:hypothetical protein
MPTVAPAQAARATRRKERRCIVDMLASSQGLGGGSDEDLVQRHAARPRDGEGDDLGDVVGGDRGGRVELLDSLLGLAVVMWSVSSVATAPGSMTITRTWG